MSTWRATSAACSRANPIERPVRLRSGKVFHLMRILPYRTADEHIDGVLVTFVNVTDSSPPRSSSARWYRSSITACATCCRW